MKWGDRNIFKYSVKSVSKNGEVWESWFKSKNTKLKEKKIRKNWEVWRWMGPCQPNTGFRLLPGTRPWEGTEGSDSRQPSGRFNFDPATRQVIRHLDRRRGLPKCFTAHTGPVHPLPALLPATQEEGQLPCDQGLEIEAHHPPFFSGGAPNSAPWQ